MSRPSAAIFYITGKGGVGKSLVARTLADAGARRGLRTARVEFAEAVAGTESASTLDAGVIRLVIDHRRALRHLLTKLLRFNFLSQRLLDSRTFSAVAAAAPGIRDLVYLSWLGDLAANEDAGFDLIIVDGLASGHSLPLLAAPGRIRDLATLGPAGRIAREADMLVRGERAMGVVIVTSPEELSVVEALTLNEQLGEIGATLTAPVINCLYPELAQPAQDHWLSAHPEASPDSALYLSRYHHQRKLVARIEKCMGPAATLAMNFCGDAPPASAANALLDTLLDSREAKRQQREGLG